MRKIGLLSILSISYITTFCQIVNIPDAIFKNYLLNNANINTNSDNEIQVSEAAAFSGTMYVSNLNISDLTGIEAFIALTTLSCYYNPLTSLDVSANTALTFLNCSYNYLLSLDVSTNTALTELDCRSNNLTNLDLQNGNNMNLIQFNAVSNPALNCIEVDNVAWSTSHWTNIDNTASFSENCSSSIADFTNNSSLIVHPNPTTSSITIQTQTPSGLYHLSDITGKTLLSGLASGETTFTLDISALSSGVYFLTLSEGGQQVVRKVIKQ